MSKSMGNVVSPQAYVERFGLDAVRYFVFREMVFGQDATFSDEAILGRYNADLANDLGNLVSRATTMMQRYCGGVVPAADDALLGRDAEQALLAAAASVVGKVMAAIETFQLSSALRDIWEIVGAANRYIVTREPWKLAKAGSRQELDTALYLTADTVRVVAELIRPFMPSTGDRTLRMLGLEPDPRSWARLSPRGLAPGIRMAEPVALFPRIERTVEELRAMADSAHETAGSSAVPPPAAARATASGLAPVAPTPPTERISIDDFMKVELRVAKVLAAERVPKSSKLLKLQVDTGADQRTIVAGIAEAYEPDALVCRSVVIVANLKPAKLMGVASNGMVLAASPDGGRPLLIGLDGETAPGTRVR